MFKFCDSFDGPAATADLLKKWGTNDNPTAIAFNPTGGRYGGGCLEMIGGQGVSQLLYKQLQSATGGIGAHGFAFAFKMNALPTANTTFFGIHTVPGNYFPLAVTTAGQLGMSPYTHQLTTQPPQYITSGLTMADGFWHWIEGRIDSQVTTHSYRLWVDGVGVINVDPPVGTQHHLGCAFRAPHEAGVGKTIWIDDFVIFDHVAETDGLVQGTSQPIGDHRFVKKDITGAGFVNNFTPSAGSNFQNVDDPVPDDDATYNAGFASGARDLFVHSALGITPTSITAAIVNMRARTMDGGSGSLKGATRSNSVLGAGPSKTPLGSYSMLQSPIYRNPDGSVAWTGTSIDAAEFGYEVT